MVSPRDHSKSMFALREREGYLKSKQKQTHYGGGGDVEEEIECLFEKKTMEYLQPVFSHSSFFLRKAL